MTKKEIQQKLKELAKNYFDTSDWREKYRISLEKWFLIGML